MLSFSGIGILDLLVSGNHFDGYQDVLDVCEWLSIAYLKAERKVLDFILVVVMENV